MRIANGGPPMQVLKLAQGDEIRSWQRHIQDILEGMHNRSFCDYRATAAWLPNINIYESRDAYQVCVELAGLEQDSLAVEIVDPQHLAISGERSRPRAPNLVGPYSFELMEIDEGPFRRVIDFSDEIEISSELRYDNGYLWIALRKVRARQP